MANLTPTLTVDGVTRDGIIIRPGESIGPIPVTWLNSDGTARSMVGATAKWRLVHFSRPEEVVAPTAMDDPASLYVAGATTAAWLPGKYLIQIWEERLAGLPLERDNEAEFVLTVK
jgi:hypothetical protein